MEDLTEDITKIANQIINLANKNDMGIDNIEWLLSQIRERIYKRARIESIK